MNEDILQKTFGGKSDYYPRLLEAQFPRVFEKLFELWDTSALEPYLDDLLMDSRDGHRKGFPPDVASEILRLSLYYSKQHKQLDDTDTWGGISETQRFEIEQLGFKHTPQGFMQAAEAGNAQAIRAFLKGAIYLETCDERNWTPLMISSYFGKEEAALLLIKSGAKVDARDINGYSPLHWAAFNGYDRVVKLLLHNGADANALSNKGWTPLMQAASRGHLVAAAQLIAGGANVNIISDDRWTALHKAASNGHTDLVRLLLSKGANPAIEYQEGCTALTLATKGKYDAIIAMLTPLV